MWKNISEELNLIAGRLKNWDVDGVPEIEKDLLLEKLRNVYDKIKFGEGDCRCGKQVQVLCEVTIPESAGGGVREEKDAVVEAESKPEATNSKLFDTEEVPAKAKRDRRVILSLYGEDDDTKANRDLPIVEEERVVLVPMEDTDEQVATSKDDPKESVHEEIEIPYNIFDDLSSVDEVPQVHSEEGVGRVIGDVLHHEQTLSDAYARSNTTTDMASKLSNGRVSELRKSIGINDKFLMIRDMFTGDSAAFDTTIDDLERFSDLNEALIHIHDTYSWNPNSEGVKLLVDLLTRKLS